MITTMGPVPSCCALGFLLLARVKVSSKDSSWGATEGTGTDRLCRERRDRGNEVGFQSGSSDGLPSVAESGGVSKVMAEESLLEGEHLPVVVGVERASSHSALSTCLSILRSRSSIVSARSTGSGRGAGRNVCGAKRQ